jgi:hypothetical protein
MAGRRTAAWHGRSAHHSGAAPLSEPESATAARLVRRVRPTVAIWFHQHLAVVDGSQGPSTVQRRFARDVGLPLRALPVYPNYRVTIRSRARPSSRTESSVSCNALWRSLTSPSPSEAGPSERP